MPAALCLLAVLVFRLSREPRYEGKSVRQWFRLAATNRWSRTRFPFLAVTNQWSNPDGIVAKVFRDIGGEAVPFLTNMATARPSRLDLAYQSLFARLPMGLRSILPKPREDAYYAQRRTWALWFLAVIAGEQQYRQVVGRPLGKAAVADSVPLLQAALHSPEWRERQAAAEALRAIGPSAAPAVPDLIWLAGKPDISVVSIGRVRSSAGFLGDDAKTAAVQALGSVGPAASNAVPVLAAIAASGRMDRFEALAALGGMGPAASKAAPTLVSLLDGDRELGEASARILAETGFTPDDAVPDLRVLRHSAFDLSRAVASLALWNRNTNDVDCKTEVCRALRPAGPVRGELAFTLGRLGTQAAPFLAGLRALQDDPDPKIRRTATVAVWKIQTGSP